MDKTQNHRKGNAKGGTSVSPSVLAEVAPLASQ